MKEVRELKQLLTICNVYQKVLYNNLKKMLNTSTKKFVAGAVAFCILAVGVIGGYLISNEVVGMFLNGDSKSMYLLVISSSLTVSVLTFGFYAVFSFISNENGALETILEWMPVKLIYKKIGITLPRIFNIVVSVMTLSLVMFFPAMFANSVPIGLILLMFCTFLLECVISVLLIETLLHGFICITYFFHIPYFMNISLSFSIITICLYLVKSFKLYTDYLVDYSEFSYNPIYCASGIYAIIYKTKLHISINIPLYLGIIVGIFLIFLLVMSLERSKCEQRPISLLKHWKFNTSRFKTLIMKEIKSNVRSEDNFILILLIILASLICRIKFNCDSGNFTVVHILSIASTLSVFSSYGFDMKYIRLYRQLGVSHKMLYFSKFIGSFIYSFVLYVILNLIFLNSFNGVKNALFGILLLILYAAVFNIIGLIIPKNPEMPTAQAAGIITILLIFLPTYYLIANFVKITFAIKIFFAFFVFICSFIGGVFVNKKRWTEK